MNTRPKNRFLDMLKEKCCEKSNLKVEGCIELLTAAIAQRKHGNNFIVMFTKIRSKARRDF